MEISDREAAAVEKALVAQHSSAQWRDQQSGCLTASLFHDIYVRKDSTDPDHERLVKQIMGTQQPELL